MQRTGETRRSPASREALVATRPSIGAWLGRLVCVLLLAAAPPVAGATDVDARPGVDPSAPAVDLDTLLKLPKGYGAGVETHQGATKLEWLGRFDTARKNLDEARDQLARVERELESVSGASSTWQVSAPGASTSENSPLSFKLRQEVKEQRVAITEAERRLRTLEVEADLASVPIEWRQQGP
jgi:hypothetical protein